MMIYHIIYMMVYLLYHQYLVKKIQFNQLHLHFVSYPMFLSKSTTLSSFCLSATLVSASSFALYRDVSYKHL